MPTPPTSATVPAAVPVPEHAVLLKNVNVTLPVGSNAALVSYTVALSCPLVPLALHVSLPISASVAWLCSSVAVVVAALPTVNGSQSLVDALKLVSPGYDAWRRVGPGPRAAEAPSRCRTPRRTPPAHAPVHSPKHAAPTSTR